MLVIFRFQYIRPRGRGTIVKIDYQAKPSFRVFKFGPFEMR